MRSILSLALGAVLTTGIACAEQQAADKQPDVRAEIITSRTAIKQFSSTLKAALQKAVKEGGPVSGITVCHEQAGQIANDLSKKLEIQIGRTSLKVRNPDNAPDSWEQAVLEKFETRKAAGESVKKLEFFEVVDGEDGHKMFRYMKAIPTAALCLTCHGEKINPEVDAKLAELYPQDQARGFKEGDLRGAFTIAKPIP